MLSIQILIVDGPHRETLIPGKIYWENDFTCKQLKVVTLIIQIFSLKYLLEK